MHILIEGVIWETRYEQPPQTTLAMGSALGTSVGQLGNSFYMPTTNLVEVPYKVIADSKEVALLCNDKGYYADVKGKILTLKEEVYRDLVKTLDAINKGEALLVNEANKRIEGKELKDVWTKQGVNVLLGIEL